MIESITIHSANTRRITPAETEVLAAKIRQVLPQFEVKPQGTEPTGYGVTLYEVLRIALSGGIIFGASKAFAEEIAKKIADAVVDWAKARNKGERRHNVYVNIYGPDGTIKSMVIRHDSEALEDRTEQDQNSEKQVKERKDKT